MESCHPERKLARKRRLESKGWLFQVQAQSSKEKAGPSTSLRMTPVFGFFTLHTIST